MCVNEEGKQALNGYEWNSKWSYYLLFMLLYITIHYTNKVVSLTWDRLRIFLGRWKGTKERKRRNFEASLQQSRVSPPTSERSRTQSTPAVWINRYIDEERWKIIHGVIKKDTHYHNRIVPFLLWLLLRFLLRSERLSICVCVCVC